MTTTLRIRKPADIVGVVPTVMGFTPEDSIVMLTFGARDTFHARVDMPHGELGEAVNLLVEPAVRHGVTSIVLAFYTDDEDDMRPEHVRTIFESALPGGITLIEALHVSGGRHRVVREGQPWEETEPCITALEAAVTHGAPLGRREDLLRLVAPDDEQTLTPEVAALTDPDARDAVLNTLSRKTANEDLETWLAHVRRTPRKHVSHAAALAAVCAWLGGNGALAWICVDTAQENGTSSLANLVTELLTNAVPPSAWDSFQR